MTPNSNRLRRMAAILTLGAVVLTTATAVPTIALAAGQEFARCDSVEFQGNILAPGRDTFFDGYIRVDHRGKFAWTCWSGRVAVEEWTDCGSDGMFNRRARGELRGGVFYFGCA